ncbi:MAG: bifunctional UDP-3-O-[3-hydroxymyristoyl] N-acetylglucosamine deacetylase/3-hydroxyacyl-ACP dehydratase [Dysgonamonadaceae bacterium]|jgi:UDP-3-O-[3-hydroxymyristoyl] N-acetylglucosamine deacetylase/3-hydroxyacyl-[acyl-carrier-protein] dehydratase|nr:bifunctional UDP-3-O-[3-hydroxymyristoyl] N-acetylglucosamine deacetylase/3-hydroxyacyl-ACP dehydratase [Dysgonamonadaceae bacterium]
MNTKQHTLKESFSLRGKGLHTGLDIEIKFNPAPVNHGYKIKRIDLEGHPVIDALAENVKGTQRGTVLSKNEVVVSTVEHAMAALYAYQVDNCLIEVNAPEFPILDGSAVVYANEIERVGLAEQDAVREYYVVKHKIEVSDSETGSSITVLPDDSFGINVHITFDSFFLDNQYAILDNLENFKSEIAASRTFVFVREIEPLLQHGLIKGGDLDNAIVIYEHQISQERFDQLADTMGVKHKDASELGYIMNKPLAYNNEPARHKLLDILGDIALIGKPVTGRIIANCPGHKINNQFALLIRKDIKINDIQAPVYNPNLPPVMDVARIRELLPHRFPFLLVDKVIELGAMHIVGLKNVSVNEPFFQGHFPEEPVMPGVLIVEAMAQAAGLLVLNGLDEPHRYSTYFMKIDNVKFRRKVVPGDTLIFKVELASEFRRGTAIMKGYTFVGEKLACEAEFMAQVIKNK